MELVRAHRGRRARRRPLDGPRRQERAPTAPPSTPCASCSTPCRWTASSSSARARRTKRRCSSTASRSATARRPASTSPSTRSTAPRSPSLGRGNAISVIAITERGTMFDPGPCVYMEKIAVGPEAADAIDLNAPVKANLEAVAKALGEDVDDVTAVILDRDRHDDLIRECREAGARIRLIPDGDVAGAISTAWPQTRVRHPVRHRRHARGRHRRVRAEVPGRRDPGPAVAAQRRRAHAPRSTPATTSTACSPPTTSCRATTCSSPPPASPTASCSRACATGATAPARSRS